MSQTTRRTFVKQCLGTALAWQAGRSLSIAAGSVLPPFGLDVIGMVRTRRANSISASSLSVGFETLDRKLFDPRPTYRLLADLGVKWARVQTGWSRTETTEGKYQFAWLDKVVDSLLASGVQPWFNLGYGNRLYTPDAPDVSAVGWAPLSTDTAREAWGRYVTAITKHFGNRVRYWEIWNEPNIRRFWQPGPCRAEDYVDLVKLSAPEIRKQVPDAVLIGGALSGMPLKYLESCMDAGLGEYVDKISYHPYQAVPEADYDEDVTAFRKLLARYKPDLKLWQGECGCPSEPGSEGALGHLHWSESSQAKWLLRRVLTDLRLEIELTSYFHTVDLVNYNWGQGPTNRTVFMGLLRGTDYSCKPSYFAYQCLTALFDVDTVPTDIVATVEVPPDPDPLLAKELIQQAAFVRHGQLMLAYWLPASLLGEFDPRAITLSLPKDEKGKPVLKDPVLIDPLTQQVLALSHAEQADGKWTFTSIPLTEYPLILTDREVALAGQPAVSEEPKFKSRGQDKAAKPKPEGDAAKPAGGPK